MNMKTYPHITNPFIVTFMLTRQMNNFCTGHQKAPYSDISPDIRVKWHSLTEGLRLHCEPQWSTDGGWGASGEASCSGSTSTAALAVGASVTISQNLTHQHYNTWKYIRNVLAVQTKSSSYATRLQGFMVIKLRLPMPSHVLGFTK